MTDNYVRLRIVNADGSRPDKPKWIAVQRLANLLYLLNVHQFNCFAMKRNLEFEWVKW